MILRPYQQAAVDAAWDWTTQSVDPFLIEAATGAGKSHIIAEISRKVHLHTGKRVLCLAPSAELVTQNRAKYLASGHQASMFSASAGAKELRHPVVFGSPLTVKNRISRFQQDYAMVLLDEAHGITPTIRGIIDAMREGNPNLRVCGLTATPYRLGSGYIFQMHPDGKVNTPDTAKDPYFMKCVSAIQAPELIEQGYLTPPLVGTAGSGKYDTSGLVANKAGNFDATAVDQAYHGHGRLTSAIVSDVVAQTRGRKGVMFFAATVRHAQEIMASLPPHMAAIVTANTPSGERRSILARFLARDLKYLVNVSVLTTGFDAPHVDCIAILRKTESVGLLQQVIGRGLRLDHDKTDCLILDYTTNIEDHCPDGDLFAPVIKAGMGTPGTGMPAVCPECSFENTFSANVKYLDYERDEAGYCLDLDGQQVETDFGPLSAHHGRRCCGMVRTGARGQYDRCGYRWTFKECPHCEAPNDIAARYCIECKGEIVDPNTRLREEFARIKRTPTEKQTDEIVSMDVREGISQRGNRTVRADFVTPWRSFSVWFTPDSPYPRQQADWATFQQATEDGTPRTVTYKKDAQSKFYNVFAYNKEADKDESE
jgi:DNA repair protein RadD